jgi:hypothetical protein
VGAIIHSFDITNLWRIGVEMPITEMPITAPRTMPSTTTNMHSNRFHG